MKIAIDAGHGFNTAGKRTPDDIREWTLNDRVLRAFDKEINKYNNVTTVRLDDATGKTDVSLFERTRKAKANKCDVLLSVHHNAYQSKWGEHGGTETLYFNGRGTESYAKAMNDSIVRTLGLRDRGIKHKNFHMVREVNIPSVMVEVGFMDSNTDKAIRDEINSELVGVNLAKDFAKFYGLTLGDKPVEKPVDKPVETPKEYIRPKGTYQEKGGWTRFTNTSDGGIYIRQNKPSTKAKDKGKLGDKKHFDYIDVYVGNGHVWVGNGKDWLPTRELDANGKPKPIKDGWGTYTAIPKENKPVEKPKKEYLQLLKTADSWAIYPLGEALVRKNAIGTLNPKKFGGLEYEILGRVRNGVTIQTRDYGKVNIYIGADVKKYYNIVKR